MAGIQQMVLPSTSDKRPSAAAFDTIIRIKVGQTSPEIFEIHKGVLSFYSGYFRKAIENIDSGRFAEDGDKMITLAEDDSDIFRLFQGWLYTRELPKFDRGNLVRLWCFGDQRSVPLLQNEAIDALCDWTNSFPAFMLNDAFENTVSTSALRKFMIASFAAMNTSATFMPDDWPVEATHDLIRYMLDARPRLLSDKELKERDTCEWHVHEEGTRCQKRPALPPRQNPRGSELSASDLLDTHALKLLTSVHRKAATRASSRLDHNGFTFGGPRNMGDTYPKSPWLAFPVSLPRSYACCGPCRHCDMQPEKV